MSAALAVAGTIAAAPAASASSHVFPTMNDSGGIYWRSGTSWTTPVARPGYGVYPGTKISVSCYQMGTANVPGSADAMWVKASWISGPGTGSGWINEHFVNDGAPINEAAPGVPPCTPKPPTVSCYGDYCSGKDPMATGCDAGAKTFAYVNVSGARLDLRWSPTCKTEWARWEQYPIGMKSDLTYEIAAVQDTGYRETKSWPISAPVGTWWTPMIYSPVHKVKAVAYLDCGDESILGSVVDCALNGVVQTAAI